MKYYSWGLEDNGDPFLALDTEDGGATLTIAADTENPERAERLTIEDMIWLRDKLDLALTLLRLGA